MGIAAGEKKGGKFQMKANDGKKLQADKYQAMILDLDGVITQTSKIHAQAWKEMFEAYLNKRREEGNDAVKAYDRRQDYDEYINGKPRYEGVRSFLESREIELPYGDPDDEPGKETVCGLGNRKNRIFRELLEKNGVEPYEGAVEHIRRWKKKGLKIAVVSSSRNCAAVLKAAGISDLFDARVDGVTAAQENLKGKPDPDIFLFAAKKLGVSPEKAVVYEDAVAGVQAGQKGKFGLVIGVARKNDQHQLQENGADVVIHNFNELDGE